MIPLFYVLWPALMLTAMHQRSQTDAAAPPALPAPAEPTPDQASNVLRYPIERIGAPVVVRERSAEVVELRLRRRV